MVDALLMALGRRTLPSAMIHHSDRDSFYGTHGRRGIIPNQVSIDDRPAIVAAKRRLGDGEGDTVFGKAQRGALGTLVERQSWFTVMKPCWPQDS